MQNSWTDGYIEVQLTGFDPTSRQATLLIAEHHANLGRYFIWVKFTSGDETVVDYDGSNPNRVQHQIVTSSHVGDSVSGLRVQRVR
jgi:hypothetical protein